MKETIKNKILVALAIGGIIWTSFFTLCAGAGKLHVYSQNYNKENIKVEEFASAEEFQAAKDAYQKEADRVDPIANGMLIAAGAGAVVAAGAGIANEVDKKKQAKRDKINKDLDLDQGFAGTL